MLAKIRHIAMYTHNHAVVDKFYQTIFGMRRMTRNTLDESGKQNTNRGHISDGVIGLAILSRYAGMQSGMDHYGFEVDDIKEYVRRMEQRYPKTMIAKGLDYVPFAGLRSYDPAGSAGRKRQDAAGLRGEQRRGNAPFDHDWCLGRHRYRGVERTVAGGIGGHQWPEQPA